MVPPDSERGKRLPTLSWTSVVDAGAADAPGEPGSTPATPAEAPADVADAPSPSTPLVDPVVPAAQTSADVAESRPAPPVRLEPMTLSVGDVAAAPIAATGIDGADIPPGASEAVAHVPQVAPLRPIEPIVFEPMTITAHDEPAVAPATPPIAIRAFAPSPIVPAVDERTAATSTALDDSPLPEIREATPIDPVETTHLAAESVDTDLQASGPNTVTAAPTLPRTDQPDQRRATTDVAEFVVEPLVTVDERKARATRKRSRRGLKLVITLVVVGGLVAAAVVFGRPYLFPSDWDAATEPYALAVEAARDSTFVEPLAIIVEPAADIARRAGAEVIGASGDDVPVWRALGLARGAVTDTAIGAVLAPTTLYSTDDGQVYVAADAAGDDVDAALARAMAAAALDQELVWSAQQAARTLDDAASTAAEVERQARTIQQESTYDGTPSPADLSGADQLPPVLAYRALAPALFAEFAGAPPASDVDGSGDNPLDGIEAGGPGPLGPETPRLAPGAQMIETDVEVGTPTAMDRSFWYLVFAGIHDAPTAYLASEAVVESSLTTAERGDTACAYATFAGSGTEDTAMLRGVLEGWSAAAPAEFASSFSVLGDGTLQLVSCDPGAGFEAPVRTTAARELLAWRTAELATIEAVAESADADADVSFAWPFVVGSGIVDELVALPSDTPVGDVADAARASVARTLTPAG